MKEFIESIKDKEVSSVPLIDFLIASFISYNPAQETDNRTKSLRILIDSNQEKIEEIIEPFKKNIWQLAIANNSLETVQFLIEERGINPKDILEYAFGYAGSFIIDSEIDERNHKKQSDILQYLLNRIDLEKIDANLRKELASYFIDNRMEINKEILNPTTNLLFWLPIACSQGDIKALGLLIKDRDINSLINEGKTALYYAAEFGNSEIIKFILEEGADINIQDKYGLTALHYAAISGKVDAIKILVEKGADTEAKDFRFDATALHLAAQSGNTEAIKALVKKDTDINIRDKYGLTALHYAARAGRVDAIKFLLEKDADITAKDNAGHIALHLAANGGKVEAIETLLEKGANINAVDKENRTALHYAARSGKVDAIKFLLKKDADITAKDNAGMTALHYAANEGKAETIETLLAEGADITVKDNAGMTALHYAARSGKVDAIKFLLKKEGRVDINATNNDGITALSFACNRNNTEVIKLLLKKGAEVDFSNKHINIYLFENLSLKESLLKLLLEDGRNIHNINASQSDYNDTLLHLAADFGQFEILDLLLSRGGDINLQNEDDLTPLEVIKDSPDKVMKLIQRGDLINYYDGIFEDQVFVEALIREVKNDKDNSHHTKEEYKKILEKAVKEYRPWFSYLNSIVYSLGSELARLEKELESDSKAIARPDHTPSIVPNKPGKQQNSL